MTNFEFRKYGNGSQTYEVFLLTGYNAITKRKDFTSIGFVTKVDKTWEQMDGGVFTGKSRKEVAEKMAMNYRLK